ncbi:MULTISPECIES: hypothetical protein [Methanoculleus]|jgi:hypothetical protein|uniref:hypothetical protein n=1 Tax=Methanoculleus TaxID=45989 RepID=UPI00082F92B3|nr:MULTISPECIES: hypothetical protein [Methanoculleus]NLN08300.1 hypothetical protein [Methanoculleus thermophilus]HQD25056.1 hypothetical protein [Methanoculleus thermophilus]
MEDSARVVLYEEISVLRRVGRIAGPKEHPLFPADGMLLPYYPAYLKLTNDRDREVLILKPWIHQILHDIPGDVEIISQKGLVFDTGLVLPDISKGLPGPAGCRATGNAGAGGEDEQK